jgi:hypothetical protein
LSVEVDGEANVTLTGQAGTSALGTISLVTNNNLSVTLNAATGSAGTVTTVAKANVYPDRTKRNRRSVGTLLVIWSRIDESQTPNYNNITDTQTSSFAEISDNQTPTWARSSVE